MDAVAALEAIRSAYVDASGLPTAQVTWEDAPYSYAPHDSCILRLQVTSLLDESDVRLVENELVPSTELSTAFVFTVQCTVENIQNTGQALRCVTQVSQRFGYNEYRNVWYGNGVAIVNTPLAPVRLNRLVDSRMLSVFAFDTTFRAVLTDTVSQVGDAIEHVNGLGTLQPGSVQVPIQV